MSDFHTLSSDVSDENLFKFNVQNDVTSSSLFKNYKPRAVQALQSESNYPLSSDASPISLRGSSAGANSSSRTTSMNSDSGIVGVFSTDLPHGLESQFYSKSNEIFLKNGFQNSPFLDSGNVAQSTGTVDPSLLAVNDARWKFSNAERQPRVSNEKVLYATVVSHLGVAADLFEIQLFQKLPWVYFLEFQAQGCSTCAHRPCTTQPGVFVVLTCKVKGCCHITHLSCMVEESKLSGCFQVLLNKFHLTRDNSFIKLKHNDFIEYPIAENPNESSIRKNCSFEMVFYHYLTDMVVSRINSSASLDAILNSNKSDSVVLFNQAAGSTSFNIARGCFKLSFDCLSTDEHWDLYGLYDFLESYENLKDGLTCNYAVLSSMPSVRLLVQATCVRQPVNYDFKSLEYLAVNPNLCTAEDLSKDGILYCWVINRVVLEFQPTPKQQAYETPLYSRVFNAATLNNQPIKFNNTMNYQQGYINPPDNIPSFQNNQRSAMSASTPAYYPSGYVSSSPYAVASDYSYHNKSSVVGYPEIYSPIAPSDLDVQQLVNHLSMLDRKSNKKSDDEYVVGRIPDLAMSQCGSRFLQEKMANGDVKYMNLIFSESYEVFPRLMVNLFGNYFCQRLFEYCDENQIHSYFLKVSGEIFQIACDKQGTRAMQKLIEKCSLFPEIRVDVLSAIDANFILNMACDPNGTHVILAILTTFPVSEILGIFNLCFNHVKEMSMDQHGLCVLKKCLSLANSLDPNLLKDLFDKTLPYVLMICNGPYGNYLVQHLLDLECVPSSCTLVHFCLRSKYSALSRQKFSSNVVEKILRLVSCSSALQSTEKGAIREDIMRELIEPSKIIEMMDDQYGNFVLQHALELAIPANKKKLIEVISPILPNLKKGFHKRWLHLMKSAYQSLGAFMNPFDQPQQQFQDPSLLINNYSGNNMGNYQMNSYGSIQNPAISHLRNYSAYNDGGMNSQQQSFYSSVSGNFSGTTGNNSPYLYQNQNNMNYNNKSQNNSPAAPMHPNYATQNPQVRGGYNNAPTDSSYNQQGYHSYTM